MASNVYTVVEAESDRSRASLAPTALSVVLGHNMTLPIVAYRQVGDIHVCSHSIIYCSISDSVIFVVTQQAQGSKVSRGQRAFR